MPSVLWNFNSIPLAMCLIFFPQEMDLKQLAKHALLEKDSSCKAYYKEFRKVSEDECDLTLLAPRKIELCMVRLLLGWIGSVLDTPVLCSLQVIEAADVILEVLDARDPQGCRCPQVEEAVVQAGADKRLVLVLNKIGKWQD